MNGQIHIYDLTSFGDRLGEIKRALLLLDVFVQIKDRLNRIHVSKRELARALGIAYRTVSLHVEILAKNGAIKYRYSGSARLNPFFSFDGTADEYELAVREWVSFRSDIPALKPEYLQRPA